MAERAPHASADWFRNDRPTRGVNVDASVSAVEAMCLKKGAAISTVERLADGGTRVVLVTLDAADTVRHAFKDKLLPLTARRTPLRGRPSRD